MIRESISQSSAADATNSAQHWKLACALHLVPVVASTRMKDLARQKEDQKGRCQRQAEVQRQKKELQSNME